MLMGSRKCSELMRLAPIPPEQMLTHPLRHGVMVGVRVREIGRYIRAWSCWPCYLAL